MPEQDNTTPEGIIPQDKKGRALWEWLKKVLKKAAEKMHDKATGKDDPDKEEGKKILKNIRAISNQIILEKQESAASGESAEHEEIDKHFPAELRNVIEDLHVDDFIDKYADVIIPKLAQITEGLISVDAGIVEIGFIVAHETGMDKALARKIAPALHKKIESALARLKMSPRQDEHHIARGEQAVEELRKLTRDEAPSENNENNQNNQNDRRDRDRRNRNRDDDEEEDDGLTPEQRAHRAFLKRLSRDDLIVAERLYGRLETDEWEWFKSIIEPEDFAAHFEDRVRKAMQPKADGTSLTEEQARVLVSNEATEFVMNTLMTLYSPILDEEPSDFFDKQTMNAGTQFDNPLVASKTFSKMLNSLREKSKVRMMRNGQAREVDKRKNYLRLEKKTITVKNDQTGQLEEVILPTTALEAVDISDFAEYLREAFDTGESTIEFGHNFKRLTSMGPQEGRDGPESFFSSVANYAGTRFTADKIDTAFRLPHNHVVQAAKQKFQSSYARMFVENRWQKDPKMMEKFLQSMPLVERRVKDELREQFGEETPDWAIEWAFQMGRTMYFGLDFGFHEIVSYADPNLKYDGQHTFTGPGAMQGYFDMWDLAKMLNGQKKDLHLAKAVWLPYTINMGDRKYDHKVWTQEGEDRWRDTFSMGRMGFAGSFLDGEKLFIDMGNITGVGGWGTNSGWRVREGYNTWLLEEFTGNVKNRFQIRERNNNVQPPIDDSEKFIRGWKRIENIGITITENFVQQYLINPAVGGDPNKPPKIEAGFLEAAENLGGFWYDRYFSEEDAAKPGTRKLTAIGKELLGEHTSRADFQKHINEILTDHHRGSERRERLLSVLHKVTTVQTFEQMPALFLTMEKQRATEYGVTLLSEMQDDFLVLENGDAKAAKDRTDTAIADLIFAQEKMRIDVSVQMEQNLAAHNNLYGSDLKSLTSSVRGGKGNMIDEAYIREVVAKRYAKIDDPLERQKKVNDAVMVYNKIKDRLTAQVTLDDIRSNDALNTLFTQVDAKDPTDPKSLSIREKKENKRTEVEAALMNRVLAIEDKIKQKKVKTRVSWWANALDENLFGHAVTQPSVAMKFVSVSATGPDTVKRDAKQAAATAELLHTASQNLYGALKDGAKAAAEKGAHAGYEPLDEWLKSFKGSIQGELGSEIAYEVSFRGAQLIDLFFKKDDATHEFLGELDYWGNFKKRSVSDSLIDEGAQLWAWDHDTEAGWANYLHHTGRLKRKPSRGPRHRKVPRTNLRGKVLGKLPFVGDKIRKHYTKEKEEHDYANSFDYHSLQYWSNSGYGNLFRFHYGPAILAILAGIGVVAVKEGTKDLE